MSSDARPFSRIGDWGTHLLEQAGAVAEAFFQQNGEATTKTEEKTPEGPEVKPMLPPLSLWEWTNLMDSEGRFSDTSYKQVMRYAFYGVCFIFVLFFCIQKKKNVHISFSFVCVYVGFFRGYSHGSLEVLAWVISTQFFKRGTSRPTSGFIEPTP